MAFISKEEVFAYNRSGKLYCPKCVEKRGFKNFELEEILTIEEATRINKADVLFFCDLCRRQVRIPQQEKPDKPYSFKKEARPTTNKSFQEEVKKEGFLALDEGACKTGAFAKKEKGLK